MNKKFLPLMIFALFVLVSLTPIFIFAEEPQPQSSIERLAYTSNANGIFNINVINSDGSKLVKITNNDIKKEGFITPIWSPDGTRLLFYKFTTVSVFKTTYDLWIANPDGTGQVKIAEDVETGYASWSPDAKKVLFVVEENKKKKIKVFNVADNSLVDVTNAEIQEVKATKLVWSPDSAKILGVFKSQSKSDIYYLKMDDNSLVKVSTESGDYENPVWSPDGAKIIYSYLKPTLGVFGRESGLYLMNSDGSNPTLLTKGKEFTHLEWSSDLMAISYLECTTSSSRDSKGYTTYTKNYTTYLYSTNGTGRPLKLYSSGTSPMYPSWSPDGKRLAFAGGKGVNIIVPGQQKPITIKIPYATGSVSWSADSTRVACTGSPSLFKKFSIYYAPIDGSKIIKLTEDTGDYYPVWSPK